jgi:hypothetical protein
MSINIDGLIGRPVSFPDMVGRPGNPTGVCVGAYVSLDQLLVLVEITLTEEPGKVMKVRGKPYVPLPQIMKVRIEECSFGLQLAKSKRKARAR